MPDSINKQIRNLPCRESTHSPPRHRAEGVSACSRELSVAILVVPILLLLPSLCLSQALQEPQNSQKPTITDVRFVSLMPPSPDDRAAFVLVIEGNNFPKPENAKVELEPKDPAFSVTSSLSSASATEILINGNAKVGTEITRVVLADGNRIIASTKGLTISIKANKSLDSLTPFEIKFDHQKNKDFPNLHSLVVTREAGESNAGFASNPHWMTVDLLPTGATDLRVVQSNAQQLDLHFVAAADYEPKSVSITVYDGSDLDRRSPLYVAIPKKEDPEQPKITGTEISFIDRSLGIGRFHIYGKGFGDYATPPYPVEDYLRNCLEPFDDETLFEDANSRLGECAHILRGHVTRLDEERDKIKMHDLVYSKTSPILLVKNASPEVEEWKQQIHKSVTVGVSSRNPDIRVEKVEVLNVNDKMIDVFFEFERYAYFALPFRMADATVTVKKRVQKTTQTVKSDSVTGTVAVAKEETYSVAYQPGPKRDSNLSYRYTVLDRGSANTLVGKGIADNFFVLQLSVVNKGDKKITIPLSAIQAEVEWAASSLAKGKIFLPGPVTLPPVPLAAVSAYFDAYQKIKGPRAKLFNILDAATMLATGLVPFAGPSFEDAAVFFSGGAVPAAQRTWGDLSGQQLQNLTALSWESSETLPAKGGSKEKLIYIPMKEQSVGKVEVGGTKIDMRKQITNIADIEITGYEVVESEAKQATPVSTSSAETSASPSQTPSGLGATSSPPAARVRSESGPKDEKKP